MIPLNYRQIDESGAIITEGHEGKVPELTEEFERTFQNANSGLDHKHDDSYREEEKTSEISPSPSQ